MELDVFVKNLLLIAAFLVLTPIALGTSFFALIAISNNHVQNSQVLAANTKNLLVNPLPGVNVYAALPNEPTSISATIGAEDARVEIIRQYLVRYKSPLRPYAEHLV